MKHFSILPFVLVGMFGFTATVMAFPKEKLLLSTDRVSLDSCRSMALKHNKKIRMAELKVSKADYEHRVARTNYLPKVSGMANYTHMSENVSLLSSERRASLSHIGTDLVGGIAPKFQQIAQGILATHPELMPLLQGMSGTLPALGAKLDATGQQLSEALNIDNRNLFVGGILLTQPIYMGGKIRAYDRITSYGRELANEGLRAEQQTLLLDVDKAYWQVVSLVNKKKLATAYRDMLEHLNEDVNKMIAAGVATRANELSVSVELNKAEMTLLKVDDGLTLSRMLLAQLCGWSLEEQPILLDEQLEVLASEEKQMVVDIEKAFAERPELRQLKHAASIYREKVKIEQSVFLPTVALTGGYTVTNPSFHNGFEKKFNGSWHVGLTMKMPLWNWGEGRNKVRAARAEASMAELHFGEMREKIELQVRQCAFAVNEADKKLHLSENNLAKAEENLRISKLGFDEGMISTTDLLAAQTAWLAAQSDNIDAQIDTKLTRAALSKALGE